MGDAEGGVGRAVTALHETSPAMTCQLDVHRLDNQRLLS